MLLRGTCQASTRERRQISNPMNTMRIMSKIIYDNNNNNNN